MNTSDLPRFTDDQWEIIEALILRQITLYNQRLFKLGLVNFELQLTEAQQNLINAEAGRRDLGSSLSRAE
jgi:hypothetical protein